MHHVIVVLTNKYVHQPYSKLRAGNESNASLYVSAMWEYNAVFDKLRSKVNSGEGGSWFIAIVNIDIAALSRTSLWYSPRPHPPYYNQLEAQQ